MKTRGFTLTELAIVLGIAGIILGSLWGIAVSATNAAKQERLAELISSIAYNMRGVYSGRAMIETTDVETLMPQLTAKGIFPADALSSAGGTTVAISPFGELSNASSGVYKSIYVCGWSVSGTVSSKCTFGAGTANVPLYAVEVLLAKGGPCENAVVRNSNPATMAGLTAVYSNGTLVKDSATNLPALPATPAQALAACTNAVNHVDFVFRVAP